MKKLLIGAVAAGLLATGTFAANVHYNQYQTKQKAEDAKVATVKADEQKKTDAKAKLVVDTSKVKYNLLYAECTKGLQAYAKLSPFTKTTLQAPSCGSALQ